MQKQNTLQTLTCYRTVKKGDEISHRYKKRYGPTAISRVGSSDTPDEQDQEPCPFGTRPARGAKSRLSFRNRLPWRVPARQDITGHIPAPLNDQDQEQDQEQMLRFGSTSAQTRSNPGRV